MPYAVELLNITKRFARTIANDNVTLRVKAGTIHALVGENGAGKTTLMETLFGLYQPDFGKVRIHQKDVTIRSPRDSVKLGIGMVHQHFMLAQRLTVIENIILGVEPTKLSFLNLKKAEAEISALAERFSLNVPLTEKIESIGVGTQQRVEILKALYRNADIMVLDEPTAVLTPQETNQLFSILSELNQEGKTIILITHKLNEVMAISQNVSVMRKGKIIGELETSRTSPEEIARLMVGRPVLFQVKKSEKFTGSSTVRPLLKVSGLNFIDKRGIKILDNVSVEVLSGEVLGIAGVEGNGQSQFVECITGLLKPTSGSVMIDNIEVTGFNARAIYAHGLAHVPEDRIKRGLIGDFTIAENLILGMHARFSSAFLLSRRKIIQHAELLIERFDIRPKDPFITVKGLSGGNQQKVIMARELSRDAKVLVACQPTRGVDIGGTEFIHRAIISARDSGKAILLISADLNEILSLSDRIAVMYNGKIVKVFADNRVDENELGLYMTGSKGYENQKSTA